MSSDKKQFDLDILYGPTGKPDDKVKFDGVYAKGMKWLEGATHYLFRKDDVLYKINADTGEETPAYDHEAMTSALSDHADFSEDDAKKIVKSLTPEEKRWPIALIEHNDAIYQCNVDTREIVKLTPDNMKCSVGVLSKSEKWLGFHADGNLYVMDMDTRNVNQLTKDGNENILNGKLDWTYQEEVYGRSKWCSYWWRDDEAHIAFLRLDQTEVPSYTIIDHRTDKIKNETYRYPKPGDPNPTPKLGITGPAANETTWVDLSKYDGTEIIICRVDWAPDGKLMYQVQDRPGTWLELNEADLQTGESTTLIRETTEAWVNPLGDPVFLKNGSFLWRSERDGWQHLYHYARDGQLIRRLTEGKWEVRVLHGVNEDAGYIYFSGTKDTVLEMHVYRIKLDGGEVERLSEPGSHHDACFDKDCKRYFDTFHNIATPPKVYLRSADSELIRVISENEVPELAEYDCVTPEFIRIPADNGFMMHAMILRPHDCDPKKKYPLVVETYSGPHAACVANRWSGANHLWHQMLVQQGYMFLAIDPESASGEGAVSSWKCYKRLGVTELADIEAGLRWMGENTPTDLDRVSLHGWSYGGFMTSFAATHSSMFKVAIAGASPTDWRLYDTIYTERFMQTLDNNREGYDETSVVKAAENLDAKLLLVHGTLDDNVHIQNSLQLVYALQKAGKEFDLMLYPGNQHGIGENVRHWTQVRWDYIKENL